MRSSGASGADDKPLTSAEVKQNSDGAYKYTVPFLSAGTYTLAFTCQAPEDDPEAHDYIDIVPAGHQRHCNGLTDDYPGLYRAVILTRWALRLADLAPRVPSHIEFVSDEAALVSVTSSLRRIRLAG
jgi:hypothetical protein